jgi:hypothetical protein
MDDNFLPLHEAAELAYRGLAQNGEVDAFARDAAATALAAFVPIYSARPRRRLSEAELGRIRFLPGVIETLLVARDEFEAGLARLRRAGVRFSEVSPA